MSKILSKIGKKKKRIAGKKNRWKKKQNRLSPSGGVSADTAYIFGNGWTVKRMTTLPVGGFRIRNVEFLGMVGQSNA